MSTVVRARRPLAVLLGAGLFMLITAVTPAAAKPPTSHGPSATISSVKPVATGRTLWSAPEKTLFCIYDATVVVRWTGSVRLDAFPIIDGIRMAPGDTLQLTGSGSRTVVVPNVLLPEGETAVFEAVAGYFVKRSFVPLADVTGSQVAYCPFR